MEKIRVDYLQNHKDYKVCQHEDMYHFNTDTCLLGEFIKVNKNETLLDVGTNNGALLIYAINKGAIATGIDINDKAIEIAKLTLKENDFTATLLAVDFKEFKSEEKFDIIISNPPYFNYNETRSKNDDIKKARHEDSLSLKDLCINIKKNLKETGRIYLVHRPDRFNDIKKNLNDVGLYINNYQLVYDVRKEKPKSLLIEASFNKTLEVKLNDKFIGR